MAKSYNKIESNVKPVDKHEEEALQKKEIVQVATAIPKKKNFMERLVVGMIGPDGVQGVAHYLGNEIILPAVKGLIFDSITSGVNMMLYGEEGRHVRTGGGAQRVDYSRKYSSGAPVSTDKYVTAKRRGMVETYVFNNREEARKVLEDMIQYAEAFTVVSVADYYEMIGITPEFTHNSYGWTYDMMVGVSIIPSGNAYAINLPKTMEIN